ncbi:hypothetical protein [Termitidicoccus mucosus]
MRCSARPLKRFLQRSVETKLARAIIAGDHFALMCR